MSRTQFTTDPEWSRDGWAPSFDRMHFLDEADQELERQGKAYAKALMLRAVKNVAAEGRTILTTGDISKAADEVTVPPQRVSNRMFSITRGIGFLLVGSASGPLWGMLRDGYQIPVALLVFVVGLLLALAPLFRSQSQP